MMKKFKQVLGVLTVFWWFCSLCLAADPLKNIPLLEIESLEYLGGFRIPAEQFGESSAGYAEGPITLGKNNDSFYMVGHAHNQAIAEFSIPELVKSLDHKRFKFAKNIQPFKQVLNRPESGNPQKMDRIGGMEYINGRLYVNTYVYYDAGGKASHTTLVIKDAANLANSDIAGYHSYSAKAHASGWISPVPKIWQKSLGGTYITGSSAGKPIINRLSVGPSAFTFNPIVNDYGAVPPSKIKLNKLLDYSLARPLGYAGGGVSEYLHNHGRKHGMWTHIAGSAYAFIVPGTRSYMAIGSNGGGESGIGYKINQDSGYTCGGYCPHKASDRYNYYWLFDINDMRAVRARKKNAAKVMPHAHGKLPDIYANNGFNAISGAAFDYNKNILYVSLARGDRLQYGWVPTIVAFKIDVAAAASKAGI